MPTIREIAEYAGVSPEGVLRVLNREPVSGAVAEQVTQAIEELGVPHSRLLQPASRGEAAPSDHVAVERRGVPTTAEATREILLELLSQTTSELETRVPEGVSSVVYEALRIEVGPMAQHIAQMSSALDMLARSLEGRDRDDFDRRSKQLEDVALLVELITIGWRTVDRRLGRIERSLERLEGRAPQRPARRWPL